MTQLAYLQTDSYNLLQIATFTTCCTTMTNSRLNPYKPLSEDNQEATFFFHQKTRERGSGGVEGKGEKEANDESYDSRNRGRGRGRYRGEHI
jgi:hypothetical protein